MKKILLLALVAMGCTDKKDKCYACEVVFSNVTYNQQYCGYQFANDAEDYIYSQYRINTVINGGTFQKSTCKRIGD